MIVISNHGIIKRLSLVEFGQFVFQNEHSSNESLTFQEVVFFPCITICNLNLVEASYFKSQNISEEEVYKMDWLIAEFIRGYSQGIK